MTVCDWSDLRAELARWRAEGRSLPVWWRDDDAVTHEPQLDTLARLARQSGVRVHLAVIPAAARPELADAVAGAPLIPVVHGWAHRNHAPSGQKKAEFGAHRSAEAMQAEAARGLQRLQDLFGGSLCPMFVPPWNRFDSALLPGLAGAGYDTVSGFGPRSVPRPVPGLVQVNTHLDPVDWRGTRGLADPGTLIAHTVKLLQDRRAGGTDAGEPLGLLTHHLIHDTDVWQFVARWLAEICDGPVRLWSARGPDKDDAVENRDIPGAEGRGDRNEPT